MVQEFGCEMEGNDAAASLLTRFDKDGQGELSYTEFVTDVLGLQPSALNKVHPNLYEPCLQPSALNKVHPNLYEPCPPTLILTLTSSNPNTNPTTSDSLTLLHQIA